MIDEGAPPGPAKGLRERKAHSHHAESPRKTRCSPISGTDKRTHAPSHLRSSPRGKRVPHLPDQPSHAALFTQVITGQLLICDLSTNRGLG